MAARIKCCAYWKGSRGASFPFAFQHVSRTRPASGRCVMMAGTFREEADELMGVKLFGGGGLNQAAFKGKEKGRAIFPLVYGEWTRQWGHWKAFCMLNSWNSSSGNRHCICGSDVGLALRFPEMPR